MLATGALFEPTLQTIDWPQLFGYESVNFIASEMQIHLFVVTVFIAFVSPFGGYLFNGLKRIMRQSQSGITMIKGGVIDRLDCIIITGCFLIIYLSFMVYRSGPPETSTVIDMVA